MSRPLNIIAWLIIGCVAIIALLAVFFGYEQPGLLLEQMNLRYCG